MLTIPEGRRTDADHRAVKVIHIVENLDRGAVENWLVRMLKHADQLGRRLDWTFYCTHAHTGVRDADARAAGGQILFSPHPIARKRAFASALRDELRRGRYDVLHCHHDLVSGLYLTAARGLPIGRRIVHVHNADENVLTPNPVKQRLFRPALRRTCLALADRIVGISNHTLDTFLAGRPRRPERDIVHYYGVDPFAFEAGEVDRAAFRSELGLARDALILLFGGRMVCEKNPVFAVDVLAQLAAREPRAVAVFAGGGAMEDAVRERAGALGVATRLRMLGWRNDLPAIMRASDWFILPRPEDPMEGFGLAVLEAQLAGLRLLLSRGVPDDPLLPTACYRRLGLAEPASRWARAAIDLMAGPAPSREPALAALRNSPMDMDRALDRLTALHA